VHSQPRTRSGGACGAMAWKLQSGSICRAPVPSCRSTCSIRCSMPMEAPRNHPPPRVRLFERAELFIAPGLPGEVFERDALFSGSDMSKRGMET